MGCEKTTSLRGSKGLSGLAKTTLIPLMFVLVLSFATIGFANSDTKVYVTPNVTASGQDNQPFEATVIAGAGHTIHEFRVYQSGDFTDLKCNAKANWYGPYYGTNEFGDYCQWNAMDGYHIQPGNSDKFYFAMDSPDTQCCRVMRTEPRDLEHNWQPVEIDICVDKTPPKTTKSFDGPQKIDGNVEWIDGVTKVVLEATDCPGGCSVEEGPHDSGIDKTLYLDVIVPDTYCSNPAEFCKPVCQSPCDVAGGINAGGLSAECHCGNDCIGDCQNNCNDDPECVENCVNNNCQYSCNYDGPSNPYWHLYTEPFPKEEESCHILQYFSIDGVGNVESMKWQCFFVDKTPPFGEKWVGQPTFTEINLGPDEEEYYVVRVENPTDNDITGDLKVIGNVESSPGVWDGISSDEMCTAISEDVSYYFDPYWGGCNGPNGNGCGPDSPEQTFEGWLLSHPDWLDWYVTDIIDNKGCGNDNLYDPNPGVGGDDPDIFPGISWSNGELVLPGQTIPAHGVVWGVVKIKSKIGGKYRFGVEGPDGLVFSQTGWDQEEYTWVRDHATPITLTCEDRGPHPSGDEEVCYQVSFDGDPADLTDDYCPENLEHVSDEGYEGEWCCVDAPKTITFEEDSLHDLEYFCRDAVNKKSPIDLEWFKVDSTPPEITKTMIGDDHLGYRNGELNEEACPPKGPEDDCYVRDGGGNGVRIDVVDPDPTGMGCAVDEITCSYELWWDASEQECGDAGGIWDGQSCLLDSGQFGEEGEDIIFTEDSTHVLYVYCEDALGNSVDDEELFLVDSTPPVTTKTLGEPKKIIPNPECVDGCGGSPECIADCPLVEWISTETPIYLSWKDEKVGTEKVWYKNVLVDDYYADSLGVSGREVGVNQIPPEEYCWSMCDQWVPNEPGDEGWTLYWQDGDTEPGPIYKEEESCHIFEYYSEDKLGNVEDVQWQCFFVDDTPPKGVKTVGEPKIPLEDGTGCDDDLTNPGFEAGDLTGWTVEQEPDSVEVVTADGYTSPTEGTYMVRLGDDNGGVEGSQTIGDNTISQVFTVSDPTLTFAYNIFTFDYTGFDHFGYKVIRVSDGSIIYEYNQGAWGSGTALKTTGWQTVELDLSEYVGEDVKLVISAGGTSDTSYSTWAYVDCGTIKDWWVRDHVTPITLDCEDQGPHPVEQETMCYRISFDGEAEWLTDQYCEEFGGEMEDGWCCAYVGDEPYTFTFQEDSLHDLEFYCRDHLGNVGQTDKEWFKVDSTPPETEKIIVPDPYIDPQTGAEYIDTVHEITLDAKDGGPICAVGGVTTYAMNTIVDEKYCWEPETCDPIHDYENEGWVEVIGPFSKTEESCHMLEYWSEDALGNREPIKAQCFFVDKKPPITTKSYDGPQFKDGNTEWITSQTDVVLSAEDQEPHPSGVAATYYRDVYLDNPDDWHYCYQDCASWDPDHTGDWELYEEPFNKEPESCHIIEYYSVDNVGKTENVKWQCVFVDNTPPTPEKTVGEPKAEWTPGQNNETPSNFYPEETQHCWDGTENQIDCWKVTMMTPINMSCVDPEPHPVDHEQVCFNVEVDGDSATDKYCEWYDGVMGDDGYCCVDHEINDFTFKEETEHNLKYYCLDALNNTNETVDEEKFKVEGTKFDIPLFKKWNLISVPFVLLDDNPEEVFKDTPGVDSVWTYDPEHVICGHDWCVWSPGDPPDDLRIRPGWGYWVLEMEDEEWLTIGGSLFSQGPVAPPSRNLVPGWNLIGYYGTSWELYDWSDFNFVCGDAFNFPDRFVYGDKVYCSLNSLIDTQEGYPRWSSLWSYLNCGDHQTYWIGLNACAQPSLQKMLDRMYAGRGYWIEMDVEDSYSPATTCIWNDDFQCKWTGGGIIP